MKNGPSCRSLLVVIYSDTPRSHEWKQHEDLSPPKKVPNTISPLFLLAPCFFSHFSFFSRVAPFPHYFSRYFWCPTCKLAFWHASEWMNGQLCSPSPPVSSGCEYFLHRQWQMTEGSVRAARTHNISKTPSLKMHNKSAVYLLHKELCCYRFMRVDSSLQHINEIS